jgi:type VI secretion system protein ImpL
VYTRTVAGPALRERTLDVLRQFAREESWVLGRTTPDLADAASQAVLVDEVQRLYLADYGSQWSAFIADLRLAPAGSLEASIEQARQLARPDSPLTSVLRAVVREASVDGLSPAPALASGTAAVDVEALQRYVSAPPSLDALQSLLGRVATYLGVVQEAARHRTLPPASNVLRELRATARQAPEPVHTMMADLAARSSAQSLERLHEPLAQSLANELAPACLRAAGARFPLVAGAGEEMSREDFTHLFATGGLMDGYFQSHLAPFVDTSVTPWLVGRGGSDAALQAFQRAQAIRASFFAEGGKRLGTRLVFKLVDMDAQLSEFALDIDGQPLRFRRAAPRATSTDQAIHWPGSGPGEVRLQVQPSAGSAYVFKGPWALLRLLERVRVEQGTSPDRALLQFDVEGRKARVEVRSAGPFNPLLRQALEPFQCPRRP